MEEKKIVGNLQTFEDWYTDELGQDDLKKWRNAVAELLSTKRNLEISEGGVAFDEAILAYLHKQDSNNSINNLKNRVKKYIPSVALDLYRNLRYSNQTWPPQSNQARKLRREVLAEKGYPCSDNSAETEWYLMKDIIEKHGKLDSVTYRIFSKNNEPFEK